MSGQEFCLMGKEEIDVIPNAVSENGIYWNAQSF